MTHSIAIDRDYLEGVQEQRGPVRTELEREARLRRLYPRYFDDLAATPEMEDQYGPVVGIPFDGSIPASAHTEVQTASACDRDAAS